MTIGSPSGSGATQNDIADGVGEANARWQTIVSAGLIGSAPDQTVVAGSGAVPEFDASGMEMRSGNDLDDGAIASLGDSPGNFDLGSLRGTILCKFIYASGVDISTLSDNHVIGWGFNGNGSEAQSAAEFRPHVGDSTKGNVIVDDNGTTTDGTVTYPDIQSPHSYAVLLDYEGIYLTAGNTGFYIDSDPRAGDSPDEEITATPSQFGGRGPRLGYQSNGNDHPLLGQYFEVVVQQ